MVFPWSLWHVGGNRFLCFKPMVCHIPLGPFSPHLQCLSACFQGFKFTLLHLSQTLCFSSFSRNLSPMRITYNDSIFFWAGFCETMGLMFLLFFSSTVTPELPSTIVVHLTIHVPDQSVFFLQEFHRFHY